MLKINYSRIGRWSKLSQNVSCNYNCNRISKISKPTHLLCNLPSSSQLLTINTRLNPSTHYFSTETRSKVEKEEVSKSNENDTSNKTQKDKSLFDTINRIKSEASSGDNDKEANESKNETKEDNTQNDLVYNLKQHLLKFQDSLIETWHELLESGQAKSIQQRVRDSEEIKRQRDSYEGTTQLMIIDEDENLGAWEKMQRRLSKSPLMQDTLGKSMETFKKSGAK